MAPQRENITFASTSGLRCAGWLYKSPVASATRPGPAIVLGHGLGGVKEMGLDDYSERFQAEGYTCLAFDYLYFGESEGEPRQLLSIPAQLADWTSALSYIRSLDFVDPEKVGIFGSSFGGGHVIVMAARDKRVKAAIAQCPFTSGYASARKQPLLSVPGMTLTALRDQLFSSRDKVIPIALAGKPGEVALMNTPDSLPGVQALIPEKMRPTFPNWVGARIGLWLALSFPGAQAKNVDCPIFFAVCGTDSVAPAGPTIGYAKQAKRGVVKVYDGLGHFEIYKGEPFERATKDYIDFLRKNLPPPTAQRL